MTDGDKSAAQRFMEEHERQGEELVQTRTELMSQTELARAAQALTKVQESEIAYLRDLVRQERARANVWLAHTLKLTGSIAGIRAAADETQRIAQEAAQAAAVEEMDKEIGESDATQVRQLAGTVIPDNKLQ